MDPVVLGISGGSGALLARKAIEGLLDRGISLFVTASSAGRQVWQQELEEPFSQALARWEGRPGFTYYNVNDLAAPIASGSFPAAGMLIAPCSMATVAAIAHGLADNLLRRAADVAIKERRPLVMMPRETPLSPIHLENLLALARLGVVVLSPQPAFYLRPQTVEEMVDYLVGKALGALGVPEALPSHLRYRGRTEHPVK